jgi:DNA-binding NtrC family response regulator
MNVLIVDDDVKTQHTCQEMLRLLEHSSIGVQNAVDAMKRLTAIEPQFDLVILDNGLPELSGMELFNILREWNLPIPVILISESRPHPEFEAVLEGFSRIQFLQKPLTLPALKSAIERSQS